MTAFEEFRDQCSELYHNLNVVANEILYNIENNYPILTPGKPGSLRSSLNFTKPLELIKDGRTILYIDYRTTIGFKKDLHRVFTYASRLDVTSHSGALLFRLDYIHASEKDHKRSHYNICAYSRAHEEILSRANSGKQTLKEERIRKKLSVKDKSRILESFHFPTGHPNFRPGLNEVVACLIDEFNLSYKPEGKKKLRDLIERRRERQIESFILDKKETVQKILEKHFESA